MNDVDRKLLDAFNELSMSVIKRLEIIPNASTTQDEFYKGIEMLTQVEHLKLDLIGRCREQLTLEKESLQVLPNTFVELPPVTDSVQPIYGCPIN